MKRRKLQLGADTVRLLGNLSGVHGGQMTESDFCATTGCPSYKMITCQSKLHSCLTDSAYCC